MREVDVDGVLAEFILKAAEKDAEQIREAGEAWCAPAGAL